MKKLTRFASMLMAIIMIAGLFTTVASATNDIHLDVGPATIYKDDCKVRYIDAYLDGFGEIRVESENDILDIFEDELDGVRRLPLTSLIVTDWAKYYGYTWWQDDNILYIYTDIYYEDVLVYPEPDSVPDNPTFSVAKVYVNGKYRNLTGVKTYGGEAFISSYSTLKKVFPSEAAKVNTSADISITSLRTWAEKYKYSMVVSGNRVYLNNDGKTPIEITLDGKIIDFPDQQPFVSTSGHTMVPLFTLSKKLGCKVTWQGKVANSTHDRVKMTYNGHKLYLWISNKKYWLDGEYYKMSVAPYKLNGRTMVPLTFIAKTVGYSMKWDSSGTVSTVNITTK